MRVYKSIGFTDHGRLEIWENKDKMYSVELCYDHNYFPVSWCGVTQERAEEIAEQIMLILRSPDCIAAPKVEPSQVLD